MNFGIETQEKKWDGERGKEEAIRFLVLKIKELKKNMENIYVDSDSDCSELLTVFMSRTLSTKDYVLTLFQPLEGSRAPAD